MGMKKHTYGKRIISMILAIALVLGSVSVFAYRKAQASESEYNTVELSFGFDGGGGALYLTATIVDGPNKGQVIGSATAYGDWGSAGSASLVCDDMPDTQVTFSTASEYLCINAETSLDTYSSIVIGEGLIIDMIHDADLSVAVAPIRIKNTLKLAKTDGVWKTVREVPTVTNQVSIELDHFDNHAIWLKAAITDGPNAGKLIGGAEAYGNWKSATGSFVADKETTIDVQVSTASEFLYVEGLKHEDLSQYTTITFKKDSLFYPGSDALTDVPICIGNDLILEQKDGVWQVKSDEKEVVTNVKVTGYEMYPKKEDGFTQLILHTDVNLNQTYPGGGFKGTVQIGDKETDVTWYVEEKLLYTVDIAYEDYQRAESIQIADGSTYTMTTNPKKKVKVTNGLHLVKQSDTWMKSDVKIVKYPVKDFEIYRIPESGIYQLIIKSDTDIRNTTRMPLSGYVYLDGKAKKVDWYVDETNGLVYTVGITLKEGDTAKRIEVAADTLFTILNDTDRMIRISKGIKLVQIDGVWMKDEGQKKITYNDVKLSYSGCDGRGFYLKAQIVDGPDKGKTIGDTKVYGDWQSSASGLIRYNGNKTMDVWYSVSGDMIYISGDYNLDTMKKIAFEKGTVLTFLAGSLYTVPIRLSNTLTLAKDTRYDRWVNASDVNKKYTFHDVKLGVTRVTGSVLEMKGTFTKNSSKKLMDVYGDWVTLNGAVTLGDPDKGKYTDGQATWSLAGDMLMLYGISAGLMDSIQIKAGTILWPDASCKVQIPIRITNDVVMKRDAQDEWIISKGKYEAAGTATDQQDDTQTVQTEATDDRQAESIQKKKTSVRLVDQKSDTRTLTNSTITVAAAENHITWIYVAAASVCVLAGIAAILWIVLIRRRKGRKEES